MKYIYIWAWIIFKIVHKIVKEVKPESTLGKTGINPDTSFNDYYKSLMTGFDGKSPEFAEETKYVCHILSFCFILMIIVGTIIIGVIINL